MLELQSLIKQDYNIIIWDKLKDKPICIKDKFIVETDSNIILGNDIYSKLRYKLQLVFI